MYDSILRKAQAYMNTPKMQKRIQEKKDAIMLGIAPAGRGVHTPEDAAFKFMDVLIREINSSGLSENAKAAISSLDCTKATKLGDGTYLITVYFDKDLSRPSLAPKTFGEIDDLAELFNDGVDHVMNQVHGEWHGEEAWSRTSIPGVHFMEQAIIDFMGNYASEYNVISVKINRN